MSIIDKETFRGFIRNEKFTSTNEIMESIKELFRDVLQETLEVEIEEQLGYNKFDLSSKKTSNSRNGYSKKTVKSELGNVEINIPRDRNGEFEPMIVQKHERNITGLEEKIIGLYARGMTTRDIHDEIKDLYDVEISAELVSKITDRIMPTVLESQNRAVS